MERLLKDKLLTIYLLTFALITIEILLVIYPIGIFIKIYIPTIIFALYILSITIEYHTKRKFYNHTLFILTELEEKYLINELIKETNFSEGKILKEILEQTDKSMIEKVNQYKYLQEDYKEYI